MPADARPARSRAGLTLAQIGRAFEKGRATVVLEDRGQQFKVRPVPASSCRVACPAGVNVKAYVGLIAARSFDRALEVVLETNPLPGICGRVCTHPCEAECLRAELDSPVAIRLLKRFIADYALERPARPKPPAPRPEAVAVVGSGPAGITAANDLARLGYRVTVFEALSRAGGMLRVGIPRFRLPHGVIDQEVSAVGDLGVSIQTASPVDDPNRLLAEGFRAVFWATGAHSGVGLGLELEDSLAGIVDCTDFLRRANTGEPFPVPDRVLVIGGGNSAVDSARVAWRLGARHVEVLYRRTRGEMPADGEEIEDAIAEGIRFSFLTQPLSLLEHEDRVSGLRCIRTRLAEPDSSGRRRPEPVPGTEFETRARMVIKAVGQRPDSSPLARAGVALTRAGTVPVDPDTGATALPGIFAGGDIVTGPATVIDAIAAGHRAARGIHAFITGRQTGLPVAAREAEASLPAFSALLVERVESCKLPARRRRSFSEVEQPLTAEQAVEEAGRCLRCGPCAECVRCLGQCSRRQVALSLPGAPGELLLRLPTFDAVFTSPLRSRALVVNRPGCRPVTMTATPIVAETDPGLCRGCGRCTDACIHDAVRLVEAPAGLRLAEVDTASCRGCGICVAACPSGAMGDRPRPEGVPGE